MAEDKRPEGQEFSFVKEKIKHQPIYQRKPFRKAVLQIAMSVFCGLIACFVFVKVYPWMEETFGEEEKAEITIPKEEEEIPVPEQPVTPPETIVVPQPQELEIKDYKALYKKLKNVAAEAQRSMVKVTAASSGTDWFNETYENRDQFSGILVGNNGVELLVLVSYSGIEKADSLQVTFADNITRNASLKKYDRVTDLAVISVNLAEVSETTLEYIRMANLGSSRAMSSGEPIIAVGSPAGVAGSVLYGNLAVANYKTSVVDGEYTFLITDISSGSNTSGVLLNLDGQIVGLIENKYLNPNNRSVLTAYGISDVKSVIEHLSNNKDLVYLGVTGIGVTADVAAEYKLPIGVYVTGVEMGSPAMEAGIQPGDIVKQISGQQITAVSELQSLLLKFSRDQVIEVVVMRQGKEGYQEISCSIALKQME